MAVRAGNSRERARPPPMQFDLVIAWDFRMHLRACQEHRKICELADDVVRMATDLAHYSEAEIAATRLAFCKSVNAHSAAEFEGLRSVPAQVRTRHADLFRRYEDGYQAWRCALVEFNSIWPLARVAEDAVTFTAGFRELVSALRARVHWEESQFFPAVLGSQPPAGTSPMRTSLGVIPA